MNKQLDRLCYLAMLVALAAGYAVARGLGVVARFWPPPEHREGVALFPYIPPDYAGYPERFGGFLPLLEADHVPYRVFAPASASDLVGVYLRARPRWRRYFGYAIVYWRRLGHVLAARRFRVAFVQRSVFPYFPDQRTPHLESLLGRLCENTILDFYDADYRHNPAFVGACTRHFTKISVVNSHLAGYFAKIHPCVRQLPLILDMGSYPAKESYFLGDPPRLFWMGSPENSVHLKIIAAALRFVGERRPIELHVVCREAVELEGVRVVSHAYREDAFRQLMRSADIALYPADDSEASRGKMALKVLQYMACGLPVVGSPFGLTPSAIHRRNMLVVRTPVEWQESLLELLEKECLRAKLGRAARTTMEVHHSPRACYPRYKEILFGPGSATTTGTE
jgi:glycosyltransferase involved in cell wall biosynthesis